MSLDGAGAVMGLAGQIKRWDEMTREFTRLARRYELQAMAARARATLAMPYFVMCGEEHGLSGSRSSQLGFSLFPLICDWLPDRAAGKAIGSTYNVVETLGSAASHGAVPAYTGIARLGVEQLWAALPTVGVA